MKLYLASANPHKAAELSAFAKASEEAAGVRIEIIPAQAVGGMPPVVEDAGTFVGNARKKAQALRPCLPAGAWALADDSGLCVDALAGRPGVDSAYFAGPRGDGAANLAQLIAVMRKVPEPERSAQFRCVLLVTGPDAQEEIFEGSCGGRLLHGPRGRAGFGYDPLFVPNGREQTFAEMDAELKNRLSHRARAWARLAEWVRQSSIA